MASAGEDISPSRRPASSVANDGTSSADGIAHVLLIGFHHKYGPQVEYAHPRITKSLQGECGATHSIYTIYNGNTRYPLTDVHEQPAAAKGSATGTLYCSAPRYYVRPDNRTRSWCLSSCATHSTPTHHYTHTHTHIPTYACTYMLMHTQIYLI